MLKNDIAYVCTFEREEKNPQPEGVFHSIKIGIVLIYTKMKLTFRLMTFTVGFTAFIHLFNAFLILLYSKMK